ncbi:hypothetical protein MKEN_00738500 [Mycena kentingensis (nom. inval.)]|nr:hypothetical protein MKEN_00738500 [Mycena kentingensis (nom. inval.)]
MDQYEWHRRADSRRRWSRTGCALRLASAAQDSRDTPQSQDASIARLLTSRLFLAFCLLSLQATTLDQPNTMPFSYARNPVGLPSRPSMTSRRSSLSAAVKRTVSFVQNLVKLKDVVVADEEPRFRRSTEEPRKPALKPFDASQLVVYPGFPRTDVLEFEIAVAIEEEEEEIAMIPAAMARVSSIRLVRKKSRTARKERTAKKMVRSVSGPAPPLSSLPAYVADEEEGSPDSDDSESDGVQFRLPPQATLLIEEDEVQLKKHAEEMENQLEVDAEALHWMM